MRRGGQSGTPIPNRTVEHQSYGTGSVKEYTLTPEQLEEIRQKYPVTKRDKKIKAPIEIKTKTKEEKQMGKFTMTEAEFKAARESGKTIAKIAEEQDVAEATVYANMKRWEAAEKGQAEQKLLREKDAVPPADAKQVDKTIHEIERLTSQIFGLEESNGYLRNEVERWKSKANETVVLSGQASEALTAERDSVQKELIRVVEENDWLKDEINRMITERDELVSENDRLNELLLSAAQVKPEPATEVQLLDRSIAELTRAKWILNRLSASGE